jgi:hypothetical protein
VNSMSGRPVGRRCVPGDATGISGLDIWLLVDRATGDDVSRACYELAQRGADVESVVDVLCAGGLRGAPDFAICATRDGIRWRFVLRGAAQVEYGAGDRSRTLTCRGVLVDQEAEAVWVSLRLGPPRDARPLPMIEDLLSVAELRVTSEPGGDEDPVPAVRAPMPPPRPQQVSVPPSATVPATGATVRPSEYDLLFRSDCEPGGAGASSAAGEAGASELPEPDAPAGPLQALPPAPPPEAAPPPPLEVAPAPEPVGPGSGGKPVPLGPPAGPDQGRRDPTRAAVPGGFIAAIPDFLLAGLEVARQPAHQPPRAASQPSASVPAGGQGRPAPGSPDRPVRQPPPVPAPEPAAAMPQPVMPVSVQTGAPVAGAGLPAPASVSVVPPATVVQPDGMADEAPSRTVSRAELRRRQLAESGGVTVVSMRCVRGHIGPAFVATCGVCGDAVPPQEPVEIPRPPLGRLVFETGDVVVLDRDVVLGRNPRMPDGHAAASPHLIKLHDPRQEVSAQHLLVCLRDWHVVVTDLGSTNGTEVICLDGRRLKLVAGNGTVVVPGTAIVVSEILTIRYEATP